MEDYYFNIKEASKIIKAGGIVVFPTETVYGIGANALNDEAVRRIFIAKGREQDNPLILHISDIDMLDQIAENITETEYKLMNAFWPGPFTIILSKKKGIASVATCNGNTVGVRMPSNEIARLIIRESGVPIAAPSANISGKPSGTNIADIFAELSDKVDYIVDGGETDIGIESTVVRVVENEVKILRPGKITKEDIEKVISNVVVDKNVMGEVSKKDKVLSPGMKYRHYAPKTKCKLVYSNNYETMKNTILEIAEKEKKNKVLILAYREHLKYYNEFSCLDMGSINNLSEVSHKMFSVLRKIDKFNMDLAIIEGISPNGLGLAIMNRLIRACEHDYLNIEIKKIQ